MNVTVRLFAMYRDEVGKKSLTMAVPAESTVREVLQRLETAHQGLSERLLTPNGKTKPAVTVLLNGRHLPEECGLETLLSEDDTPASCPNNGRERVRRAIFRSAGIRSR